MTFEERYDELREQSDSFNNKNMIRHHFIRNMKEVAREAYEEAAKICEEYGEHCHDAIPEAIRAKAKELK